MSRNRVSISLEQNRFKNNFIYSIFSNLKYAYSILSIILIFKFILLFGVLPQFSSDLAGSYGQTKYADAYDRLAFNLAEGNGYRFFQNTALTVMREPGYPLFLAGIFKLFGKSLVATQLANIILSLGTLFIIYKICVESWSKENVFIWISFAFIIHPGVIIAESRGGYEILFMLLLCGFVFFLLRASRTERLFDYIKAGLMLGLCVVVKSTLILFPFFYLLYQIFFLRKKLEYPAKPILNFILVTVSVLIVLSPWILRNYWLTGKFIPTASVFGVSAHAGQYIAENLNFGNKLMAVDYEAARQRSAIAREYGFSFRDGYYQFFYTTMDEIEFNKILINRVLNKYIEEPNLFVKACFLNAINFWFAGKNWYVSGINILIQLPLLLFAGYGCLRGVYRKDDAVYLLCLIVLCYYCSYIPILGQARYSIPLVPFLCLLGCSAIWNDKI